MQIRLFKKEIKFKHDDQIINPRKHWAIILYVLLVLVIGSFVFGFFVFKQEGQVTDIDTNITENTHRKINRDNLQKILDIFSEREKKSAEILATPAKVTDPSR